MSALLSLLFAVAAVAADKPDYRVEAVMLPGEGQAVVSIEAGLSSKAPAEVRPKISDAVRKAGGHLVMGGAPEDMIFFFAALPLREQRERMAKAVEAIEALGSLHHRAEWLNPTLAQREEEAGTRRAALKDELSKLGEGLKSAPVVAGLVEAELARLSHLDFEAERRQGALILHLDAAQKKP